MMKRRTVLLGFGASALIAPCESIAQPRAGTNPKIGWLVPGPQTEWESPLEAYRRGMEELGYVDDRTVETEYVYGNGQIDRLHDLAAGLVEHKVNIIVTVSTPAALAAKQATTTIPIVFAASSDPISTGVVTSLAHPGGNATGLSTMASDLSAKRLELIVSLLHHVDRIAMLWDNSNPGMAERVQQTETAAEQFKIAFLDDGVHDLHGLEAEFVTLVQQHPTALVVTIEPFTRKNRNRIIDFAMRNRLPAMYEDSEFVEAGGLMSYGPSILDLFQRSASYVDKILKGARPEDLPVEQPTKFELAINLKTAKALDLNVPDSVLARADKVIE